LDHEGEERWQREIRGGQEERKEHFAAKHGRRRIIRNHWTEATDKEKKEAKGEHRKRR